MNKNNGGQAFPISYDCINPNFIKKDGMTLRDYFAGQALVGLFSDTDEYSNTEDNAKFCYKQADAMLKEREK